MSEPKGIGGWLLVFVVLQAIGALLLVLNALAMITLLLEGVPPQARFLVLFELAYSVAFAGAIWEGLFRVLKRKPSTPRYWRLLLPVAVAGLLMDAALTYLFAAGLPSGLSESLSGEIPPTLISAAVTTLWALYWFNSRRVENTFITVDDEPAQVGNAGLDALQRQFEERFHVEVQPAPAQPTDPVAVATDDDPFRGRPTRSCPECGQRVLASAEFCRTCKNPIPPPDR